MKRLILTAALLAVMLPPGGAPATGQDRCAEAPAWPSFERVAKTARSIFLVTVTESVDGIAVRGRTGEVMRGSAPGRLDLRTLKPRRRAAGCPGPSGPYARVGQKLLVAYDGLARDGVSPIDAVALVGAVRGPNRSRLERLTIAEARAYDAPAELPRHRQDRPTEPPLELDGSVDLDELPRATAPASVPDLDVLWSCGGDEPGFPRSALEGPLGVERARGAVFDGLRRALRTMRPEFLHEPREDRPHDLPWLLVHEAEDAALFLVRRTRGEDRFAAMVVAREGDTWGFGGYFEPCRLRPLVTHGLGEDAIWRIDPSVGPAPEATTLAIEVNERACASGRPADGRIADPIVDYGEDAITITIAVRRVEGDATCPSNPWTPFTFELDEPIGERRLLDGGPWPPEQRWPPR